VTVSASIGAATIVTPFIEQIEQLQRAARSSAGSATVKRTPPQWHPPVYWAVSLIPTAFRDTTW
jgi:hypothetical protein